jgi:predicted transcriptional regulator
MLKELRTQHRTIIQMVFSGYKNNEIAERLEMTPTTVSQIIRSPLGQAYLEGLQDKAQEATLDVRKKLVSMNKGALDVLARIMNPAEKAPHSVQLTAAKDVLDRTGYKAPDRLHVDMTMQTKTDQEIDAEINAMQQSIAKTYMQSPEKITSQEKTEAFINEQPQQAEETVDDEDMDSSDQLANFNESSNQDDSIGLCENPLNSPSSMSEESISLLSKIPPNIFKN